MKTLMLLLLLSTRGLFAQFDATIPVLDMNDYLHPDTKHQFVQELHDAFSEVGFFALIHSGVEKEVLDDAYHAAAEFYALPLEEKLKAFDPAKAGERGYTAGESAKDHAEMDFKEFYSIGRELDSEERRKLGLWENLWPKSCNFKKPFSRLYQSFEEAKEILESAIAEALGIEPNFFTSMTYDGDTIMRAIHYPENPPRGQFWAAEHTDIGLFTILPRPTAAGLQVKNKEGEWIDVIVPLNAFIVNAGDMLENITNGQFHSGLHRVLADDEGYERYAITYFVHPRAEADLTPLSSCVERTGGVALYPKATRQELLEERLCTLGLADEEMLRRVAESGIVERMLEVGRPSSQTMEALREAGLASESILNELDP